MEEVRLLKKVADGRYMVVDTVRADVSLGLTVVKASFDPEDQLDITAATSIAQVKVDGKTVQVLRWYNF